MDLLNLLPEIASRLGLAPSSLLFWLVVLSTVANAVSRRIPDDATGALGVVRDVASVLGVHVATRIAPGVTVQDVTKAALKTPPIPEKVAAERVEP